MPQLYLHITPTRNDNRYSGFSCRVYQIAEPLVVTKGPQEEAKAFSDLLPQSRLNLWINRRVSKRVHTQRNHIDLAVERLQQHAAFHIVGGGRYNPIN
jgi:hypothetical protein